MADENIDMATDDRLNEETMQEESPIQQQAGQGQQMRTPQARPPRRSGPDENTIYIGRKSTMGYVLAVVTQFNSGAPQVKVKARGKLISKAVDVAEIARGRFLPNSTVDGITIMTEEVQNEDGSKSKVSSIEITLKK